MAKKANKKAQKHRQPIVTILGHVDHGKTTLLDYIKKTHLVKKEAGGITQSIGAYQAEFKGNKLTFIDTPGHAAFSKMRSRGAAAADLAILVVAADDGVKPQTIESISHLKSSKLPFIVALNKVDSPGSNPDVAKGQLTEHEVFVEGYGGNTPVVELSAKEGTGVDSLLENILLLAELEEIPYDENSPLEAIIIEAKKDQKKGILVNAVLLKGKLNKQDEISTPIAEGKVRALFDENGKQLTKVLPGEPVQILGFKNLPEIGEVIKPKSGTVKAESEIPLEVIESPEAETIPVEETDKLNVIIKADTLGSLEAIKSSLTDEIYLILSGTGDISESDVLLASTTGSIILGFNAKVAGSVKRLAENEEVIIKTYRIIYELLEFLEKKALKLIDSTFDEEVLGEATVLKLFEINKDLIAGCSVTSGTISVGDTVHLKRNDEIIKGARVKMIKTGKDDLKKVSAGSECGILLNPKLDIRENDAIISYNKKQEED